MVEFLILVSQRPIVIGLAILGAVLVTAGSLLRKSPLSKEEAQRLGTSSEGGGDGSLERGSDGSTPLSRALTWAGYVFTFISIALFIVAGFVADLEG